MKTIFMFRPLLVLLLFSAAIPFKALAEDFEFKTNLVHEVAKVYTPVAAVDCDGNSTPGTPQNYTAIEVMANPADFTAVSFRVYYFDNLVTPAYNFLNVLGSSTFNATTGELSYTMTGIAQTRKKLIARVYLNDDGTGVPFEEKEFYTSQANSNPPIGTIIPFYGTAASAAALNLGGWFLCDGTSIASISNDVLFPAEKTALQSIIGSPNLPDLRGLFLRGIDPAGTYDAAGRAVGNVQTEQLGQHSHNYDKSDSPTGSSNVTLNTTTTTVTDDGNNQVSVIQTASLSNGNHSHALSYTPTTTSTTGTGIGSDNRPDNAAVNYLIKVRY